MKQAELSLQERVSRMYRRLLLLQRLFHPSRDDEEPLESDDRGHDLALDAAVREVLDELTEHARVLTTIPSPISQWRPGDTRDDERWRALTEVERREILSLVSGYDELISWAEDMTDGHLALAALVETTGVGLAAQRPSPLPQSARDAAEYLRAERTRISRFRQEMRFLNRRNE